ncbi:hypothetical protein [Fodinicurvata fenggangensis]|uniref:hypothetical protein n=1 Tax=Fodinicurvata fenggangensis TaxID=1121830 RepID=UPI0012DF79A0|nr:hypothetical protein [Fodinicurvata fenggangensis]
MDSSLLAVLRYLGRNQRPRYERPPLQGVALLWEVAKDLVAVACTPMPFIKGYETGAILLTSNSHKTREVRTFITGILESARFDTISYGKRIPLFSFLLGHRFLKRRLGKVLRRYSWIRRRYSARIGRDFLKFFLYEAVAERRFAERPPAALAIVSDLGARRIAFARAARKFGALVIYYQYWQHHSFRPPFRVDYAICINNLLADRLKASYGSIVMNRRVYGGKAEDLSFRTVPDSPVIGITTNVYPDSEELNRLLAGVQRTLRPARVLYKPHPRTTDSDIQDIDCEIFDRTAGIEEFARAIDLCISGNTTAILKVLLEGTPCLYLYGLDAYRYDRYGYVGEHAVIGGESLEQFKLEDINAFYSAPDSLERVRAYMERNMIIDKTKDETPRFIDDMQRRLGER